MERFIIGLENKFFSPPTPRKLFHFTFNQNTINFILNPVTASPTEYFILCDNAIRLEYANIRITKRNKKVSQSTFQQTEKVEHNREKIESGNGVTIKVCIGEALKETSNKFL